jgi:hypothetical protein
MTTKAEFSVDEWNLLLQGATNVAMYISLASPGVVDSIKESFAAAKAIAMATQQTAPNELMGALISDFKNMDALKQAQPKFEIKEIASIKGQILGAIGSAGQALDSKATAAEADYVKRWLYQVVVDAANAAKEGDFLGIGGVRVSDEETAALGEIASTLNLKV